MSDSSGEDQLIVAVGCLEFFYEAVSKISAQHLHGCEEFLAAAFPLTGVDIEAAVGHHSVNMRMKFQLRIPCMQYGGTTDANAAPLGVGCNGGEGLSGGFHQDVEHDLAIGEGDLGYGRRQGENRMEIWRWQQFVKLFVEPCVCRSALTCRAMTIPARVIDDVVSFTHRAVVKARPHIGAAALDDFSQHLQCAAVSLRRVAHHKCGCTLAEYLRQGGFA